MPTKPSKLNTVAILNPSPDLDDSNLHLLLVTMEGNLNMSNSNLVMDASRISDDPDPNLNLIMAEDLNSSSLLRSLDLGMAGGRHMSIHINRISDPAVDQNLSSLRRLSLELGIDGDPNLSSLRLLNLNLGMAGDPNMANKSPSTDLSIVGNQSTVNMDPNMGGDPAMVNPNLNTDLGMAERQSMKEADPNMEPDTDRGLRASMDRVMEVEQRLNTGPGMRGNQVMVDPRKRKKDIGSQVMVDPRRRKKDIGSQVMVDPRKKDMAARNMAMTTVMMMMKRSVTTTAISTTTISATMTMTTSQTGHSLYKWKSAVIAIK